MPLQELLNIAPELTFLAAGDISDSLSTHFAVRKLDYEAEANQELRACMKEDGLTKCLVKDTINSILVGGLFVIGAYGIDKVVGIETLPLNIHHAFAYGKGTLSYLSAAGNVAQRYGYDNVGRVFHTPVIAVYKAINKLTGQKFLDA